MKTGLRPYSEDWWQAREQRGRCVHKSRENNGGRCRRAAIAGATICTNHGVTKAVRARAAERVAQAGVEAGIRDLRRLGLAPGQGLEPVNPAAAMLEALALATADMRLYAWLVSELDEGGLTGELFHLTGEATGEAKRTILVEMYETSQDRVSRIAAACLRAKVAEAHVEAVKQQASALADFGRALCLALGQSPASPQAKQALRLALEQSRAELPSPSRATQAAS